MSHIWMRDVMSMNASCHTCSRQADRVVSTRSRDRRWGWHMKIHESCHTYEYTSVHVHESVMSHMNELCHIYAWVMLHVYIRHPHTNESYHTCEWVMSHMWTSHVTLVNVSRPTYEWHTGWLSCGHQSRVRRRRWRSKSKMLCCNVRGYVALVAVCCSVLQCAAVCCSTSQRRNAATCAGMQL